MIKKSQLIHALAELPEDVSIDDVIEKMRLIEKINKGINDARKAEQYLLKRQKKRSWADGRTSMDLRCNR